VKYLAILLFYFSINSYSTEIKEKVLICIDEEKYINKDITKSDYIFGYVFNNKSANYYYNSVMSNGMYEIDSILNVKYNINENFIIMDLEFGNLFINRKTLEHNFNNNITARCELAIDKKFFFDLLKERKKELNNQIKKNG
tara:strand:- start:164 stop:586 length:423 start_codon:yes stop_codon:yes gene_type:complete